MQSLETQSKIKKYNIYSRLKNAVKQNKTNKAHFTSPKVTYTMSDNIEITEYGGLGLIKNLIKKTGLDSEINNYIKILKNNKPYLDSDHILNLVFNIMCGGENLQDINKRRFDTHYLDAIGAESIPGATTAGDFCRRFTEEDINIFMDIINAIRLKVWKKTQPEDFYNTAIIDIDGLFASTTGECKEGMDINYKGDWGYHPLILTFAKTGEILYICNRPGNVASHQDAYLWINKTIKLLKMAGFKKIMFRGDTDFSLTEHFDEWTKEGITFVFGYDASEAVISHMEAFPEGDWDTLIRKIDSDESKKRRSKPENIKQERVQAREYEKQVLVDEEYFNFPYKPGACDQEYNMVAVKKHIEIYKGSVLDRKVIRHFFYIENDNDPNPLNIIKHSNDRCNQENTIGDHKKGVKAFKTPMNTLEANWVWMICCSLAWSLKTWMALYLSIEKDDDQDEKTFSLWPEKSKKPSDSELIMKMEFKQFLQYFMRIPARIIETAKGMTYELLAWNKHLPAFIRLTHALE